MRTLLDLVVPVDCAGCGRPDLRWCIDCHAALAGPPVRVWPRGAPGISCWTLGSYAGPARRAVLAAKERGRRDLAEPLGVALAAGLAVLRTAGRPLVLVPAPSRAVAARRRGGDPVLRSARVAARCLPDCWVLPILRMGHGVRDSVGLTPAERARNLRGRVVSVPVRSSGREILQSAEIIVVDDVVTTGATVHESVCALVRAGLHACGVLVTCAA
ncbi:ComF family protein [Nocardia sp. CNY236]|uniref:ComF family protein n=1 Tax=Nocardia sp. CNY236 TaxID=1169152 RepID=UPI00048E93B0|nr:ComF family protein [Nocardia sp. CNY236]